MLDISLYVNGLIWRGWQNATVTHSMDSSFGKFELSLTAEWPEGQPEIVPPIRKGDDCKLELAGKTVVTGFINGVNLDTDDKGYTLKVRGRDYTALLFKGCVLNEPSEWKGVDALFIANEIAAPFGIKVRADAPVGAPFEKFTCQPGATANRAISRLCGHRALMHHADSAGNLVLTNADVARDSGQVLVHGNNGNVLQASYADSLDDQHSEYVILNQKPGQSWGTNNHNKITARAKDNSVKHYCPKVIIPDEPGDEAAMKALAVSRASLAAGRARFMTYIVDGWWKPGTRNLWFINETIPVRDAVAAINDTLLIKRVIRSIGPKDSPVTALTVVDKAAYALVVEPEKKKGGWS